MYEDERRYYLYEFCDRWGTWRRAHACRRLEAKKRPERVLLCSGRQFHCVLLRVLLRGRHYNPDTRWQLFFLVGDSGNVLCQFLFARNVALARNHDALSLRGARTVH